MFIIIKYSKSITGSGLKHAICPSSPGASSTPSLLIIFTVEPGVGFPKDPGLIGNKLPIHAGIPGPASIKTLINYARSCGIGNSLRFLSKQAFNLTKLATLSTPDKLIYDLANYAHTNKSSNLENIHFYAFGGIKKTADWLNQLDNSDLNYNNKNQFVLWYLLDSSHFFISNIETQVVSVGTWSIRTVEY